jgi:hypothetical protein
MSRLMAEKTIFSDKDYIVSITDPRSPPAKLNQKEDMYIVRLE